MDTLRIACPNCYACLIVSPGCTYTCGTCGQYIEATDLSQVTLIHAMLAQSYASCHEAQSRK